MTKKPTSGQYMNDTPAHAPTELRTSEVGIRTRPLACVTSFKTSNDDSEQDDDSITGRSIRSRTPRSDSFEMKEDGTGAED